MQENFYQELDPKVIFTDGDFKEFGESRGYTFGQVPYHRGRKHFFKFLIGKIPEWRGWYSEKWLSKEIPGDFEIVFSFVYSPATLLWGDWISKKKRCKLVIHIADHSKSYFEPKFITPLMTASSLFVISNRMKNLYEKKTRRKDIEVFHNFPDERCFPDSNILEQRKKNFSKKSPFIVTFIGGLFDYLHSNCMEDIILAISQLNREGSPIELHIFGERHPKSFLKVNIVNQGITHHGLVMPLEKKYEIMRNSDAFVIPSSFDNKIHKDYRYSFPTKLTEFIACGTPLLYYGPSNTATDDFLKKYNIPYAINKRSTELVKRFFLELIVNYDQSKSQAFENSLKINQQHGRHATLNKFHENLFETISLC